MKKLLLQVLLPSIALLWGVFASCAPAHSNAPAGRIAQIQQRGTLLVGATGDYRPLSYLDPQTHTYWGFDADLAEVIAHDLGVEVQFVPTSWPTLTDDMLNEELFDIAMCGITITDARRETMLMSHGYLHNGKTILCRQSQAGRYNGLDDINQSDVRVMVNPGGLNEKFAHEHLDKAQLMVHPKNEEIPALIADSAADIMITEIVEALYYTQVDPRLAAPLIDAPFTHSLMGVLMRKGDEALLERVNLILDACEQDGTLQRLHQKYGFSSQKTAENGQK